MMRALCVVATIATGVACERSLGQCGMHVLTEIERDDAVSDLDVSGDLLFIANRSHGLVVMDVSDPSEPVEISATRTGFSAMGVFVSGDLAYVADGWEGLSIYDVSQPASPTFVGGLLTEDFSTRVHVAGDLAYLIEDRDGVRIIDVSDPGAPVKVGDILTDPWWAQAVAAQGDLACVAVINEGVFLYDVSVPAAPVLLSQIKPGQFVTARDVVLKGEVLYTATSDGLIIADVSDPKAPVILSHEPSFGFSVAVEADVAFSGRLESRDVSDPTAPALLGSLTLTQVNEMDVEAGTLYAAHFGGFSVVDVSTPTGVRLEDTLDTDGFARGLARAGDVAYVADTTDGVRLVDVSDFGAAVEIGSIATDMAWNVFIDGDTLLIADGASGVHVAQGDEIVGSVQTDDFAWDVAVTGDLAAAAVRFAGAQLIDVSDPEVPTIIGTFATGGDSMGVGLLGDRMIVADIDEGTFLVDISDPTAPMELDSVNFAGNETSVVIVDGLVLVCAREGGVHVIDVSGDELALLSTIPSASAWHVDVTGNVAFVADIVDGLLYWGLEDPTAPEAFGALEDLGSGWRIDASGSEAVLSAGSDGVHMVDIGACEPCGADFNGDGVLNVLDFVDFQLAWVAEDPEADCNGDGSFSVLDFVCFQTVFTLGCG